MWRLPIDVTVILVCHKVHKFNIYPDQASEQKPNKPNKTNIPINWSIVYCLVKCHENINVHNMYLSVVNLKVTQFLYKPRNILAK